MVLLHKLTVLHFTAVIYNSGPHCIFLLKAHADRSSVVPFRRKDSKMAALWCQHIAKIDFD